ncbi:GNAT family N-acetyltransferase [Spiribacter vilamensis]|nr:GNAT family N-acetyltransferase [Spiribacter vilamensis]
MESTDRYRVLCEEQPTIPLFSQAWWLDAVVGPEQWSVVLALRGEEVVGALPYFCNSRWGMTFFTQPPLTQTLGPWMRTSEAKYAKALAMEKDVLGALADGLPEFALYRQNWDWARTNWLPFYWKGFEQTTRYTYVLPDISDPDALWQGVQKDIRGNIRKASNRFGVQVRFADDIGELFPVLRKTFDRQGKQLPFAEEFLYRVDRVASEQGKRAIVLGEDGEGQLHAGTYIVWEGNRAYQLLNGYDPELRQSGAGSLCVWSAIQKAAEHVGRYDFEGSMLEPVERFFRAFGAAQTPYFRVQRTDSRILRLAECGRNLLRKGC